MTDTLDTPVVMVIFNRPDRAGQVFARVREAKPRRLFVLADGPRAGRDSDEALCEETRAIAGRVDWPCEVTRDFSDVNLGCGGRVTSGLDRVFAEVEEAIVIEDDCLPHPTFFSYCAELLQKYRGDERVFAITGGKYPCEPRTQPYSYRFTRMFNGWGWASWRRSWQSIDFAMAAYPEFTAQGGMAKHSRSLLETQFFSNGFDKAWKKEIEPWDWALMFQAYTRRQLFVTPDRNLISNTGWGAAATQSKNPKHILSNLPAFAMKLPLSHPPVVAEDEAMDRKVYSMIGPLVGPRLFRSIKKRLRWLRRNYYVRLHEEPPQLSSLRYRPGGR
jgi:hypothetical protein